MNRSMWARAAAVWLVLAACTNVTSPPPGRAGAGPRRGSRCSGGGGTGRRRVAELTTGSLDAVGRVWFRRKESRHWRTSQPWSTPPPRRRAYQSWWRKWSKLEARPGRARCGSGARTARASPQGAAPAAAAEQEALARGR